MPYTVAMTRAGLMSFSVRMDRIIIIRVFYLPERLFMADTKNGQTGSYELVLGTAQNGAAVGDLTWKIELLAGSMISARKSPALILSPGLAIIIRIPPDSAWTNSLE
jgi:hypothetical protein